MGAIGVVVAFNRLKIAIVLSLINILTLMMVGQMKEKLHEQVADTSGEDHGD
jgi:hypothetical protein